MFTCGVCNGKESRKELVEKVFRVEGRYVLVGRSAVHGVPTLRRAFLQPRNDGKGASTGPWRCQGREVCTHAGVRVFA